MRLRGSASSAGSCFKPSREGRSRRRTSSSASRSSRGPSTGKLPSGRAYDDESAMKVRSLGARSLGASPESCARKNAFEIERAGADLFLGEGHALETPSSRLEERPDPS